MLIDLKPCPFCGGNAEIITGASAVCRAVMRIWCPKCGIGTANHEDTDNKGTYIKIAVETWNRRVSDGQ